MDRERIESGKITIMKPSHHQPLDNREARGNMINENGNSGKECLLCKNNILINPCNSCLGIDEHPNFEAKEQDFCEWKYDEKQKLIDFSCHSDLFLDVSPNDAEFQFCPYCGKPLREGE